MRKAMASRIGGYVQVYTCYSSVRPFGISAIFGGVDEDGPQLYVVEPSGVFYVRTFCQHLNLTEHCHRVTAVLPLEKVVN